MERQVHIVFFEQLSTQGFLWILIMIHPDQGGIQSNFSKKSIGTMHAHEVYIGLFHNHFDPSIILTPLPPNIIDKELVRHLFCIDLWVSGKTEALQNYTPNF